MEAKIFQTFPARSRSNLLQDLLTWAIKKEKRKKVAEKLKQAKKFAIQANLFLQIRGISRKIVANILIASESLFLAFWF